MQMPVKSGPRFDQLIIVPKVRVIDHEGENLGVMNTREAMEQATNSASIWSRSRPAPIRRCANLDVGKYRFEAQKKANAARKTQKTQDIKEIKMRPNIDTHDYDVKMRSMNRFFDEGDRSRSPCASAGVKWRTSNLGSTC